MVKKETVSEVLSLYKKFGWQLRRVLLRDETQSEVSGLFEDLPITRAEINAVWFSRPALNGGETWELRHLSETPFALLEVFDADEDEEVRNETLSEIEDKFRQTTENRKGKEKTENRKAESENRKAIPQKEIRKKGERFKI